MLRSILFAICGNLLGATVVTILIAFQTTSAHAGWFAVHAVLAFFTLPLVLVVGVVAGLAGKSANRNRLTAVCLIPGMAIALAPMVVQGGVLVVVLLALGFAAGIFASVWSKGPLLPTKIITAATVVAVLLAAIGWLLPEAPHDVGALPQSSQANAGNQLDSKQRPNIAVIVLDTVRASNLGCYGYERGTTPYLDEVAARGIQWRNAKATGSHTPPSHASIFTGLLPSEHGTMATPTGLSKRPITLAERLSDDGYATMGVVANYVIRGSTGFGRGFQVYDDSLVAESGLRAVGDKVFLETAIGKAYARMRLPMTRWSPLKVLSSFTRSYSTTRASQVNELAEGWMAQAGAAEQPFFLFLNYMDAHSPYQAPEPWLDRFLEHDPGRFRKPLEKTAFTNIHDQLMDQTLAGEIEPGSKEAEEVAALLDRYDGELAYLDSELARIENKMVEVSGDRPWLILFTSDHGEHFGEHQMLKHGNDLWEETQHVPLLAIGSKLAPQVVEGTVSILDIPGTVLHLSGAEEPLGHSRTLLNGKWQPRPASAHPLVVAEHGDPHQLSSFAELRKVAVYQQMLKTHLRLAEQGQQFQIASVFDLGQDPAESAATGANTLESLAAWAAQWWETYEAGRKFGTDVELSESERVRLAELGYATDDG
ncbi:MAG: sulfatase [Planctomycetes bacterium]|nr:sulfatase [Planctomycetota bacterium]MCP4771872.1 sulfatase [Planctomycetota bacterium]MCP4861892.1 sulfatase [Planctomycetota bacterium]